MSAFAERQLRDFSDLPVVAPVLNSFTAQESGKDYGDYVAAPSCRARPPPPAGRPHLARPGAGDRGEPLGLGGRALPRTASTGPTRRWARAASGSRGSSFERASGGIAVRSDLQGRLALEGGEGDSDYLRATAEGRWLAGAGAGASCSPGCMPGVGSDGLPAYRSFVLGGRGTLVRRAVPGLRRPRPAALAQVEWRFDVAGAGARRSAPSPQPGRRMTLAPFLAAGWAERPLPGCPGPEATACGRWRGWRVEWFMRLIRIEAGVGLRDGHVGVTVDINRDWWGAAVDLLIFPAGLPPRD